MKTAFHMLFFIVWYIWTIYTDKDEYRAALLETGAINDK